MTFPACSDRRCRLLARRGANAPKGRPEAQIAPPQEAAQRRKPQAWGFTSALFALAALFAIAVALTPLLARAAEPFVVRAIRVEGVQRTEAGTIFSYLPLKVGDRVDEEKLAQAVQTL